MRRTIPILVFISLLGAACAGSDSEAAPDTAVEDSVVTDETETGDTLDPTGDDDAIEPAPLPASSDKPTDIAFPGEAPESLTVTILSPGEGPESELGDTVIVDYIGVRSLDGEEFDNSYDRGTPFAVGPLGNAQVIQGWNDGLIDVQAGARLQLDIPSALAYGEAERSEIIRENEPLTFVIDVRSIIKQPDPADAPTESGVEVSEGATELSFEDLVEGDGAVLEEGQTAVFHLVLFRADNGAELESTWTTEPIQTPMTEGGFPALVQGMPGMSVGGRRAITAPPSLAFGDGGNPQIGLPADTDVVIVVDLLGAY
jgi:FKBP-type peptidyl-prolyl cis-trans isomerase